MILVADDQRNIVKTAIYRGADCMDVFCRAIREFENELVIFGQQTDRDDGTR